MSENKSERSNKKSNKTSQKDSGKAIQETPKRSTKQVGSSISTTRESKIVTGPRYYALKILSKTQITSFK